MGLNESQIKLLNKLYYSKTSACQLSGANQLYRAVNEVDSSIKKSDIDDFLSGESTYTLHKKVIRKYPRLKTIPCGLNTDWQADLAQLDRLAKMNDGFSYLLVCIDVLSRKIYVEPVKSKMYKDIHKAFNKIFENHAHVRPWKLFTDQGLEFNSREMKQYFKDLDIIKLTAVTNPKIHASIVERAIRTIKGRLFRYFTKYGTRKWIDIIQDIVCTINNTVNRTNGCAPNVVSYENASILWKHVYGDIKSNIKKPKFKKGDNVRIEKQKGHFEKGYLPNFSDEIFTIVEVNNNQNPVVYRLSDDKGELLKGWFYTQDLCKVKKGEKTEYRIEKILKTRKAKHGEGKEYFVKWVGYDNTYNCWIHDSNILTNRVEDA